MKYLFLSAFFFIASCMTHTKPESLIEFDKQELVDVTRKVADWQIENLSYQTTGNLHDYGIDAWTNSVFYFGLARWAATTDDSAYFDWLYNAIGEENNWQIPANFVNYPAIGIYHADELCIGQFYIEMYKRYGEQKMLLPTRQRLDTILADPPNTSMSNRNKQSWTWCDALFMAPPVYLNMANLKDAPKYRDFMHQEFLNTYNHLFDKEASLFYRDAGYFDKREENGEKIFWGRGNGWVLAGLATLLQDLPDDLDIKPFYSDLFQDLAHRLVGLQDEKGAWHASLLDPENYPAPETSATALIAYALAYGINSKLLKDDIYVESLHRAWSFLLSAIDGQGKLGWVQPIGADPKAVTQDMTAVFGVGSFLLAASEVYKIEL